MKILHKILILGVFLLTSFNGFGQEKNLFNVSEQQIYDFVTEVYADKANDMIFNNKNQLKHTKELLQKRIVIVESKKDNSKLPGLLDASLFNKFNASLKKDSFFNLKTFNPLKYNLNFYSGRKEYYRVNGTQYILIIEAQNNPSKKI